MSGHVPVSLTTYTGRYTSTDHRSHRLRSVVDDGDTTTSPPTRLSAQEDDTVDRCSEENLPAALLKLGLRRLPAYPPPPYGSTTDDTGGAGYDSRFLAPPPALMTRSRSGVAGRWRGALWERTRALADSVAAM